MESSHVIKQETSSALESLHDLTKWKFIVISGLAAAGLGLTPAQGKDLLWLLLLIPYAAAYIDLNSYQYWIRIIVVSRFFLDHDDDVLLQAWEKHCQELHKRHGVFDLGQHAQIGTSLIMSLAPAVTCIHFLKEKWWGFFSVAILLWIGGIWLVISLWRHYNRKFKLANTPDVGKASQVAAA